MLKCAIYPRKSKQVDNSDSMDVQVDMCIRYLNDKYGAGKYTVAIYDGDYGITGHSTKKRKDFQRMMQDICDKKINLVLIQRYDRIARNTRDFCNIFYDMEKNGCNLVSVSQQIDTTTPYGKKFMYDQASMAELEWALCSERRRDANRYARSIGKCTLPNHSIPFGYKAEVVDGMRRMVKDKEKEPIVLDIFDYFSKYTNYCATAKYINDTYGVLFSNMRIKNIINNPLFYGEYGGNESFCEPYISKEQWKQIQTKKPLIRNDPKKKTEILFSGMIKCPVCHHKLRSCQKSKKNGNVYRYFQCEQHAYGVCSFTKVKSELLIEEMLVNLINNRIENLTVDIKEREQKKKKAFNNTAALEKELERLNLMFLKGRITEEFYDTEYLRITTIIDRNKAITGAEQQAKKLQEVFVTDWTNAYYEMDKLHKKLFWRDVVKEIVLDDNALVVDVIFS